MEAPSRSASSLIPAAAPLADLPAIKASIDVLQKHTSGYQSHPAVMDSALHLAAGISDPRLPLVLRVPASVGSVTVQGLRPGRVYPNASQTATAGDSVTCGITLCTAFGSQQTQVSSLVAKEMQATEQNPTEEAVVDFLYETEMQACQIVPATAAVEQPVVATLGARQNRKARLLYGQLIAQGSKLPEPSNRSILVEAVASMSPQRAVTRYTLASRLKGNSPETCLQITMVTTSTASLPHYAYTVLYIQIKVQSITWSHQILQSIESSVCKGKLEPRQINSL